MQQWRKVYNNSKQKMIEMSKATEEVKVLDDVRLNNRCSIRLQKWKKA